MFIKCKAILAKQLNCLKKTLKQTPDYAPAYNNLAIVYHLQDKFEEAKRHYHLALEKEPQYVDAYYNLGLTLNKNGEPTAALQAFEQVLKLMPEHAPARYQEASILMQGEKWDLALADLLELAAIHPRHFETQINLGVCFLKKGQLLEAKKHYLKALELEPQDAQALFNLGFIHTQQGKLEEAIQFYKRLIELYPEDFAAHYNLGIIFYTSKHSQAAKTYFEKAANIQPDNTIVAHLLKIIEQDPELMNSAPEYLKNLFDSYAGHYEPHLLSTLSYQVPQALAQAFRKCRPSAPKKWQILDLGCGTGLCGEAFKDDAASLVGVDLSAEMLKMAAEKNLYQELICHELLVFLQAHRSTYDLILAGDVLVYLGDLSALFQEVKKRLNRQGLFMFNTEISTSKDFMINPSGRFTHSKTYLDKLAKREGFRILFFEVMETRKQNNEPVLGHVYALQIV